MKMMKKLTKEEITSIISEHALWLKSEKKQGKCAVFSDCIISDFDFRFVNLSYANFYGTEFIKTNFISSSFNDANFQDAYFNQVNIKNVEMNEANLVNISLRYTILNHSDFSKANLSYADLRGTTMCNVDLSHADLHNSDICDVDFRGVSLAGANLQNVIFNEYTVGISKLCPEKGSFIWYKKAQDKIVMLEITEDAKRSSATSLKCRCSKAKVLAIKFLNNPDSKIDYAISDYDPAFIYEVGEIVEVPNFDEYRWNECSTGIHFFMSEELARKY